MEQEELQEWVGKTEQRIERIAPFPANALAATLERDDPVYSNETALPPLWHWLHFLPVFKLSDAGYDGHAALGSFLPPVPLPRRMWAGSRLNFHAPMQIGQELKKISTIKSVKAKTGRSGQLVFVTVGHQVFDGVTLGIDEEHDIVYREEPKAGDPAPTPPQAPSPSDFSRDINPDPVLLFRYSALTFNGHRIHYDQPYACNEEGYPNLVVQGPLTATLLQQFAVEHGGGRVLASFDFRGVTPLFVDRAFTLEGREEDENTLAVWARGPDGELAMSATVGFK